MSLEAESGRQPKRSIMKAKYFFYLFFLVAMHYEVNRLIDSNQQHDAEDSVYREKTIRLERQMQEFKARLINQPEIIEQDTGAKPVKRHLHHARYKQVMVLK
jgi:hypothetical protein